MTREGPPAPLRRIVAPFEDERRGLRSLELAAEIARGFRGELLAVFVESLDWLRAADFPGARAIGLYSATSRPIRREEVELELRAAAARAARVAADVARRFEVSWSFQVLRGSLPAAMLEAVRDPALIEIHARRPLGPSREVAALFDGSEAGRRAVRTAAEIAHLGALRVRVVVLPPGDLQRDRREIERLVAAEGVAAVVDEAKSDPTTALAGVLERSRGGLVVLPAGRVESTPAFPDASRVYF